MTKRNWLTKLVCLLPLSISFIEPVRIGQDTNSYVRLYVFGINLGIWHV